MPGQARDRGEDLARVVDRHAQLARGSATRCGSAARRRRRSAPAARPAPRGCRSTARSARARTRHRGRPRARRARGTGRSAAPGSTDAGRVARGVVGVPLDPAVVAPARQHGRGPRRSRQGAGDDGGVHVDAREVDRRAARRRVELLRGWAADPRASAARPSRSPSTGAVRRPRPARRGARRRARRRASAHHRRGDRSTHSSARPVSRTWTWASTKPGATSAPSRSIDLVGARREAVGGVVRADPGDRRRRRRAAPRRRGRRRSAPRRARYRVELTGATIGRSVRQSAPNRTRAG